MWVLLGSLRWIWWLLYTSLGPLHSNVRQWGILETPAKVKDPVWTCGVYWLSRCLILLCEQFYPYG